GGRRTDETRTIEAPAASAITPVAASCGAGAGTARCRRPDVRCRRDGAGCSGCRPLAGDPRTASLGDVARGRRARDDTAGAAAGRPGLAAERGRALRHRLHALPWRPRCAKAARGPADDADAALPAGKAGPDDAGGTVLGDRSR